MGFLPQLEITLYVLSLRGAKRRSNLKLRSGNNERAFLRKNQILKYMQVHYKNTPSLFLTDL
jgi:hypothetical protein